MAKLGKTTFTAASAALVMAIVAALPAHEGRKYVPYWDKLGRVWTVCAGVTGPDVIPGKTYTSSECDSLEAAYVTKMLGHMGGCVHTELEFHEIRAWGDFAYNVGTANFCNSTAARLLNAGENKRACAQIPSWVYAGGKDCRIASNDCAGIPDRREWEYSLCTGDQS
jgi:GH24 family phage-related lysozyme (muramidase)